jgi:hypothetical protein
MLVVESFMVSCHIDMNVLVHIMFEGTVGYAGTNIIGSRTSFVIASVRSSIR